MKHIWADSRLTMEYLSSHQKPLERLFSCFYWNFIAWSIYIYISQSILSSPSWIGWIDGFSRNKVDSACMYVNYFDAGLAKGRKLYVNCVNKIKITKIIHHRPPSRHFKWESIFLSTYIEWQSVNHLLKRPWAVINVAKSWHCDMYSIFQP